MAGQGPHGRHEAADFADQGLGSTAQTAYGWHAAPGAGIERGIVGITASPLTSDTISDQQVGEHDQGGWSLFSHQLVVESSQQADDQGLGTTGSERFEREESSAPTTPERASEQKVHTRVIARGRRNTSRPIDGGADHQHYQRHRRTHMHAQSRRGKQRLDDLNGDAVDRSSLMASWLEGLVIRKPAHQEVAARSTAEASTQTPSDEQQALAEAQALRDVAMTDAQAHCRDQVDCWQRLAQRWQRQAEEAKVAAAREAQQLRAEVRRWKRHYATAKLRALGPPRRPMVSLPSPQQPTASPTSSQRPQERQLIEPPLEESDGDSSDVLAGTAMMLAQRAHESDDDSSDGYDGAAHDGDGGVENPGDGGSDHLDGRDCDGDDCSGGDEDRGDDDDGYSDDHDDDYDDYDYDDCDDYDYVDCDDYDDLF